MSPWRHGDSGALEEAPTFEAYARELRRSRTLRVAHSVSCRCLPCPRLLLDPSHRGVHSIVARMLSTALAFAALSHASTCIVKTRSLRRTQRRESSRPTLTERMRSRRPFYFCNLGLGLKVERGRRLAVRARFSECRPADRDCRHSVSVVGVDGVVGRRYVAPFDDGLGERASVLERPWGPPGCARRSSPDEEVAGTEERGRIV